MSTDATPEEIHAAYRRLARGAHPDAGTAVDDRAMSGLNEAWRGLRDPARRAVYDGTLRANARAAASAIGVEPDDDDRDVSDDAPRHARRSLLGLPWVLVLGALALIFVFTAYAASRKDSDGPDGVLKPGSCVALDRGFAREVSCVGDHAGVVDTLVPLGGECRVGTDATADPGGTSTICVRLG